MAARPSGRLLRLALACAGVVLALDTLALARRLSLVRFPGEMDDIGLARRSGQAVAADLARSARETGVAGAPGVAEALSALDTAIGLAASAADVARALSYEARNAEEAMAAARVGLRVRSGADDATVRERISLLQEETRVLREELAAVRQAAGMEELVGPGVIVQAYDARDGYRSREIVHERDVKDILNVLFYAGATGAEVGGQRVTTHSSVRCAGPVLLVNQQPVPVNPVVIEAVGDPEALEGAVSELEGRFARDGKRLVADAQPLVSLVAFSRGRM